VVIPQVQIDGYIENTIKSKEVKVEQKDIDRVIDDLLGSRTTYKEVDRPSEKGDKLEIDFVIKHNEKVIEGGESNNHPFVIGESKFAPGFEDHVIGMSKGDEKAFDLDIPKDYYQESIAGKTVHINVTVKKVEKRERPELNDEFVQTLGMFQKVEDLKKSIEKGLKTEGDEREKSRVRVELLTQIIDKNKIEVPEVMINRQLDNMVQGFDAELHQRGMELGPYLAHMKKTQEDLRNDWKSQASKQVKMDLALRAIAKKEKIVVGDSDVQQQLEAALEQFSKQGSSPEDLKQIDMERTKAKIYGNLLNEKVFAFLLKNNTVV